VAEVKMRKSDGLTFEQWQNEVDKILLNHVAMTADEMADYASRFCYDSDYSAAEGAIECLEQQDAEFLLDEAIASIEFSHNL
jgi:hypothetical protein